MGSQLTDYKGAVVFVDILGFGALTTGAINLSMEDFNVWTDGSLKQRSNQYVAASILVKFRATLQKLQKKHKDVTIAQLSDCFFAWSKKIESVIRFTHAFMHEAIKSGLLCRGGMAWGEIIETEQAHSLGRLIVGEAVTTAVGLEKLCKGARILFHPDLHREMHEENSDFMNKCSDLFQPLENPLDFQIYDEFKWYIVDDLDKIAKFGLAGTNKKIKLNFTKARLKLDNKLIFSPEFGWNSRNAQGLIQLQATSKFISVSGLADIDHQFERRGFPGRRTNEMLFNADMRIDRDDEYKLN